MERCQETSHAPPMVAEVTASTPHQTYQGTVGASAEARVVVDVAIKTSQNLNESYSYTAAFAGRSQSSSSRSACGSWLRRPNSFFADRADACDVLDQGIGDGVSLLEVFRAVVGEPNCSLDILPDERLQG
jgi:hypothetical protein